jgi:predicted Zn-dependent peptidase
MPFHHHALANGLTIIGETSPSARSAAVGFFVKTGSRDETAEVSGVSHFLEHMVFKGTPHRNSLEVNRDFDKIGASYNAFTSEENTVFYAAILPEYLPQAMDILSDILRPSLRGEDFDMEKKVIIEEIGMYDDQPTWCAYDNAKKTFFADHPLGNSVLGSVESIQALKREQMQAYYDRRYVAPNITLAIAGNFAWPEAIALAEKHCASWPRGEAPRQGIRPAPFTRDQKAVSREKVAQEHVFVLSPGPGAADPMRYAADTLAMIIGDDSGSRYHWELVDPGLVESADMSFHDYEGAGAFFSSFSCEPANTEDNLAIVRKVLRHVQGEGVTAAELTQAKSKILSRVVRGSERPMGRMQALGMSWTYLRAYRSVDEELGAYEAVSLKDIRAVLDRYPFERLTVVGLGPLSELAAAS